MRHVCSAWKDRFKQRGTCRIAIAAPLFHRTSDVSLAHVWHICAMPRWNDKSCLRFLPLASLSSSQLLSWLPVSARSSQLYTGSCKKFTAVKTRSYALSRRVLPCLQLERPQVHRKGGCIETQHHKLNRFASKDRLRNERSYCSSVQSRQPCSEDCTTSSGSYQSQRTVMNNSAKRSASKHFQLVNFVMRACPPSTVALE